MFKSIYNQIDKSGYFFLKNDIFIQKQETISMFDINKKEKEAMDAVIHREKVIYPSNLENYYYNYSTNKIIEKNISLIKSLKSSNIAIDCGCGQGEYLEELSLKFEVVIAIDLSLEAVLYAKETNKGLKNILYVNGSMLDFYRVFDKSIADFCLSAEVIEHVPSPDEYLKNIYNLLNSKGQLLISTPCQNLYFYPFQFLSMLLTKPKTLYKLLNPLENWKFALDWHPAMSKKDFLNILYKNKFKLKYYQNFVPYYFDKFPILFYMAKLLPKRYSYIFYKIFLEKYNTIIEKLEFGIRQHSLLEK